MDITTVKTYIACKYKLVPTSALLLFKINFVPTCFDPYCDGGITRYCHSVCVNLVFKRVPEDDPSRDRNMLEETFGM
jgi:hypothetical protein